MKGLIFTMLVLGSFSVFAAQTVDSGAVTVCGDRGVADIMGTSGETSVDPSTGSASSVDGTP